jgi:hypothetical protein
LTTQGFWLPGGKETLAGELMIDIYHLVVMIVAAALVPYILVRMRRDPAREWDELRWAIRWVWRIGALIGWQLYEAVPGRVWAWTAITIYGALYLLAETISVHRIRRD